MVAPVLALLCGLLCVALLPCVNALWLPRLIGLIGLISLAACCCWSIGRFLFPCIVVGGGAGGVCSCRCPCGVDSPMCGSGGLALCCMGGAGIGNVWWRSAFVPTVIEGLPVFLVGRGLTSSQTMFGSTNLSLFTFSLFCWPVCWWTMEMTFPLTLVTVHSVSQVLVIDKGSFARNTTASPG